MFFISIMSLGKAGIIGLTFGTGCNPCHRIWSGIILIGTAMVGLVVLFNTSLDQVFKFVKEIWESISKYILDPKWQAPGRFQEVH